MACFRVFVILLCFFPASALLAQNDEDNKGLSLVSEAELYSADINLKGEEATDDEKKEDKKRKCFGIGEFFTVTLEGKAALMEPVDEIQWEINKGLNLLKDVDTQKLQGKKFSTFEIRQDLSEEEAGDRSIQISVKVKKEEHSPKPVELQVVFPDKITARHIPSGGKAGSPIRDYKKEDTYWVGASMIVNLSLGPTNVNFSNIQITEMNDGEVPPVGNSGSLVGRHDAGSLWKIDGCNKFDAPDAIGISRDDIDLNGFDVIYPNRFSWKCAFRTSDGQLEEKDGKQAPRGIALVEDVVQEFCIEEFNDPQDPRIGHKTTISKFKDPMCTVERIEKHFQIYSTEKSTK